MTIVFDDELKNQIEQMSKPDPWTAGKDLFGKHSSGRSDLSQNRKVIVRDRI
jgi:hypothetical protein